MAAAHIDCSLPEGVRSSWTVDEDNERPPWLEQRYDGDALAIHSRTEMIVVYGNLTWRIFGPVCAILSKQAGISLRRKEMGIGSKRQAPCDAPSADTSPDWPKPIRISGVTSSCRSPFKFDKASLDMKQ
jgi:hypothetical protein